MSSDGPRRPSRGIVTTWPQRRGPSGARWCEAGPIDGRRLEFWKSGSLVDPGRRGSGDGVWVSVRRYPRDVATWGVSGCVSFGSPRLTRPRRESTQTRAASARRGNGQGQSWRGEPIATPSGARDAGNGDLAPSWTARCGRTRLASSRSTGQSRRSKGESPGLGTRANARTLMTTSWLQRPVPGPFLPSPKVLLGASSGNGRR